MSIAAIRCAGQITDIRIPTMGTNEMQKVPTEHKEKLQFASDRVLEQGAQRGCRVSSEDLLKLAGCGSG